MKKNIHTNYSDFDSTEMLKTIWEKKLIIILIVSFSILISLVYYFKQPTISKVSIIIKVAKYKESVKFLAINEFVDEFHNATGKAGYDNSISHIDKAAALDKFISEIMDYEELIFILGKNETIKEKISKLPRENQQRTLYNYARALTIKKMPNFLENFKQYKLSFVWHDTADAKKILEDVLILTEINLGETLFDDLRALQKIRKRKIIDKDLIQIEYLKEQNEMANAINLETNIKEGGALINREEFIDNILGFLNAKIYTNQALTFLKGSKAIEEEIQIIKNRKHVTFDKFEKRLNDLEDMSLRWVDYNLFLMNSGTEGANLRRILIISTMISLIIAVFFVVALNEFRSQKNSGKKLFKHRRI